MSKKILSVLCIVLFVVFMPVVFGYKIDILQTNPSPVRAGEYADITIRLIDRNPPDTISENVNISIRRTGGVRPVEGHEINIGRIRGGDDITRTFRVYFASDTPAGNVPITFQVKHENYQINILDEVFLRGTLKVPELQIGKISSTPNQLLRDTKNNRIDLTLQNLGDKTAELILVEVVDIGCCIEESYTYSMRDFIGSLSGGEEGELSFTFDILDTAKDLITPNLKVRYRTEDDLTNTYQTFTEHIPFEIPLSKSPNIVVEKVEPMGEIKTRTQENKIRVVLKNTGDVDGESLRLRLYPDPTDPIDFERTNYFVTPRLSPGENASVIINFDVLDFASIQDYKIKAELESLVGENRYSRDDIVNIGVTGEGTNIAEVFRTIFIVGAVSIAIILGVIVILRRVPGKTKRKS